MYNYRYLLAIKNRLEDNIRKPSGSAEIEVSTPAAAAPLIPESNVDLNDDDMSRLRFMGDNLDTDTSEYPWLFDPSYRPPSYYEDEDRPNREGSSFERNNLENPSNDPGYYHEYAWQYGGYSDETLPQYIDYF